METTWSERTLAAVCLAIGMGVTWFALDILTDGLLTRSLAGPRKLAEVIDFPGSADESA